MQDFPEIFNQLFHYLDTHRLPFIKGIGYSQQKEEYYWEGMNRQDTHYILQYTLSGKGFLDVGRKRYCQEQDSFFLVPVPSHHSYYKQSEDEWEFIYIEFSKEIGTFLLNSIEPLVTLPSDNSLKKLLLHFIKRQLSQEDLPIFENAKIAYELVLEVMKCSMDARRRERPEFIEEVYQYLVDDFASDIYLDELAKYFHVSKYKIIREFDRYYGESPMAFLKRYRIFQSLILLRNNPELAINQVAERVGFSTSNYFAKVFKKEMGESPSEYRSSKT
ncbi:AraC family transcriptional regulator [Carnobacterium gallinarum]|uniref:AraC family transcriptional regulator n=1 Tax=Carnobacterium gallinarum TaxID=2749 RepID=UPI0005580BCD|nr:AraC family transcriptional regulator [Carnobacterium gallinarum]